MYNITAITKGESIYLRYYDSPMPIQGEYGGSEDAREEYEFDCSEWQQSVKEVKVHPDYLEYLDSELAKNRKPSDTYEKGIPCDFLKDRIEIKSKFKHFQDYPNKPAIYAILKPLDLPIEERQEDTQEEMMLELIGYYNDEKSKHDPMEYWIDTRNRITKELVKRFKITKNK